MGTFDSALVSNMTTDFFHAVFSARFLREKERQKN
jgi:hypothetical protein